MKRQFFLKKMTGALIIISLVGLVVLKKLRSTPQKRGALNASPSPKARVPIDLDPSLYKAYLGQYEFEPGKILTITLENNRLMHKGSGGVKAELFPMSETRFFRKDMDMLTVFVKDTAGQVTHLLHQHEGQERTARKIAGAHV